MRFNWRGHGRVLLMGLLLAFAGGGCSSQQQDQGELQLEQGAYQQGEQGATQASGQQGESQEQLYGEYDSEESEEAVSQNTSEGNYASANQEENYNTSESEELESLMEEDGVTSDSYSEGGDYAADNAEVVGDNVAYDDAVVEEAPLEAETANYAATNTAANTANNSAPAEYQDAGAGMAQVAAPAQVGGLPELGSKMNYVVQRGETLAVIAQNIYGDVSKWREIAELTGMENPNLIYPGDVVYYQLSDASMAFASAYENLPREEVSVQSGDSLATIAKNIYGDSAQWKAIWRQNDQINNPDQLEVGQVIYFVNTQSVMAYKSEIESQLAAVTAMLQEEKDVSKEILKNIEAVEKLVLIDLSKNTLDAEI